MFCISNLDNHLATEETKDRNMSQLFSLTSQVAGYTHIGFISEHKNPIVGIHFLNEWGDLQVVPYKAQTSDGKISRTCVTASDILLKTRYHELICYEALEYITALLLVNILYTTICAYVPLP